jgi:hypothetical protein
MRIRIGKGAAAYSLLGAAVLCAWSPATGAGSSIAAASAGGPAPGGTVPAGATLGCSQLETLWEEAGGSPSAAFMAAEIARAESGGQKNATNYNTNGTVDRGLWQINSIWPASTFDPMGNARAAVSISQDGTNWNPWVTFQRGMEDGQC